ncbi:MAG TPA: MgtC/SapB family protein [Kofleriaceae bacterium]
MDFDFDLHLDAWLLLRIAIGTFLGAVIGYERDIHGRPAGLRTHALVALASSTFMVISTHMAPFQHYEPGGVVNVDTSRIAASVVSGIGFLAGGAILRQGLSLQGLTTAAGLWLVAAIGLAAGGGMYVEAAGATVLGIGVLTMLRRFEDKDDLVRRRLVLVLTDAAPATEDVLAAFSSAHLPCSLEGWDHDAASNRRQLTLTVRLPRSDGEKALVALLTAQPGVARMQLDPAA